MTTSSASARDFRPLFDGRTLAGWYAVPRTYGTVWPGGPTVRELMPDLPADYEADAAAHPAQWTVADGAIEGFQDPAKPGSAADFLAKWRFGDWNALRIRCVGGALPTVTTWVNDILVAEVDLAALRHTHFDPDAVAARLGESGHLAFEVHDNDPRMGDSRWAPGARCRWRGIEIREL